MAMPWMLPSPLGKPARPPSFFHVPTTDGYLQIADQAIFGDCIGAIAWIPTAVSLLVLVLRHGLHPLWRRRPIWLRDFAAEDLQNPEDASAEAVGRAKQRSWTLPTTVLLINSAIGLAVSLLAGLNTKAGPLFLTPLVAHVSKAALTDGQTPTGAC